MKRFRIAMQLNGREGIKSLIEELKSFTRKRKNTDMLWHVMKNYIPTVKERDQLKNENILLRTKLEYAQEIEKGRS